MYNAVNKYNLADCSSVVDVLRLVSIDYPKLPLNEAIDYANQLYYDDCQGTSFRIINPIWPSGDGPHREKCHGCKKCEDLQDYY